MQLKIKILIAAVSLLLLLALLIHGCNKAASPVLEAPRVIQVGAILPLDGPWSTLGQHAGVALNLALSTLNTYLKKDNLKLELVVENSSGDAGKALAALKTLHARGVRAVIGPITSEEAAGIVDFANSNGIMLVSPSSIAASLALPDNLFRLAPNDSNQAEALSSLMKRQKITQALPVYLNDAYGRGLEQGFRAQAGAPAVGIEVLKAISYDSTVTDFAPLVKVISDAVARLDPAVAAILLIGRDSDAVSIFSGAGLESPLAGFKWFSTSPVIREGSILANAAAAAFAAKVHLEGFTFASEATAPVVPTMLVAGLMSAELGAAPSPSTLPVWDALWFIGEAYRLNPQAGTAELMENFKSTVNNGVNFFGQTTKLDANGDMIPVRYARFTAEEIDGAPRWNLKGMFIKSISLGTLSIDAISSFTPETGTAVIGAVLPLTGVNAEDGVGALKAINLALEHAKLYYTLALGLGINFKVEVRDTGSNPATALAQVQALHELGVDLLIGPESSGELAAVEEYVKASGMVILSTTSTAPSLAKPDDRILRLTANDTHQAKALTRLIDAQEKQHVMLIYRNDRYGQDFASAFSELFKGSIDGFIYETNETSFSSVLDGAASRIKEIGTTDNVAVLVVGLKETIQLLEQVKAGPLTSVDWYGTDGISQSRELLVSKRAEAVAEQTHLTCSAFDLAGLRYFVPPDQVLDAHLTPLLGGPPTWNEISAYDAAWIAASAFAMTSPRAGAGELWNNISKLYGTIGMGGSYAFDKNGDRSLSSYAFYTVQKTASGPAWKPAAFYRDFFGASDDLYIIGK